MKLIIQNKNINRFLQGISNNILNFMPGLKAEIKKTDVEYSPSDYIGGAIFTSFVLSLFFGFLLFFLNYFLKAKTFIEAFRSGFGIGIGIFFASAFFLIFY